MTTVKSPTPVAQATLAMNGGPKAFDQAVGRPQPKIGVGEFLSIAERFGFTDQAMARLRAAVSDSDLQGHGPNLARFATAFPKQTKGQAMEDLARSIFDVTYARGVSSGTGALHAAMVAVGVRPGTEVIVPATGFVATAAAVIAAGGTPVFCDIDSSLTIDPDAIEALVNERTVAVAPTHWISFVCDMDRIMAVAGRCGIKVVEDCAQAPGASYHGRPVGSIGALGCFSISAYKIIGGGEGGLFVSNDQRLFERASQLAECGGLWRPNRFAPSRYQGELFSGANYRLSELEAAVDLVQLGKLADLVGRFRRNGRRIFEQLRWAHGVTPRTSNDVEGDIGILLAIYPDTLERGRRIVEALLAEGVATGMRGDSVKHDWHYYADMMPLVETGAARRVQRGDCPVADELFARVIHVPVAPEWTSDDCDRVALGINKVFDAMGG